jgi:hypothetical protein
MHEYYFTIVKPATGLKASLSVNEISQRQALKVANQKAKKLGYVLIY